MKTVSTATVAAPFIVGMAVQVIAWLATLLAAVRVPALLANLAKPGTVRHVAPGVTEDHIADIVGWGIDLAAAAGCFLPPLVGVVLLSEKADSATLTVAYAVCAVLSALLFVYIYLQKDATVYLRALRVGPFSPGVVVGLAANGVGLVVALNH